MYPSAGGPNRSSLNQTQGVTFTVGTSPLLMQSAIFGLYLDPARGQADRAHAVELRLYDGNRATGDQFLHLGTNTFGPSQLMPIGSGGSLATWNLAGGVLLNANSQYTLAVRGVGNQAAHTLVATSTFPSWVESGLVFDHFTRQNLPDDVNGFYVQINGVGMPEFGTTSVATPEPSTMLFAGSLVGLGGIWRWRNRRPSTTRVHGLAPRR